MLKSINNGDEPIIIADYKFDGTRIGDCIGSFIEHWCLFKGKESNFIRNFSIQYMKEFMPMPSRDKYLYGEKVKLNTKKFVDMGALPLIPKLIKSHIKGDGNAYFDKKNSYKFGVLPMFSLNSSKNKSMWQNWRDKTFFDSPQKCTDDTKFAIDMIRTYLRHDDVYQLSSDRANYKIVAPDTNFANKSSTEKNFEHDYMKELASNYESDLYAKGEYGPGAEKEVSSMSQYVHDKNVNFSQKIAEYKQTSKAKGKFGGTSYGNGSVMRTGPNIFVAQGFKQGLKLTEISVSNTHDSAYSIKSAKAVETVGLCANYGLRRETILKIIHFLYYDPDPLKTEFDKGQMGRGRNCFLKCGKLDFCNFDMLSHRKGKVSKNTTPQELQLIDEKDTNDYIENNEFTEKCLPTAMLAIKICLTSKCAKEAMSKILRAAGDCDTIGATAIPMVAALFGLPKEWVNRIYEISMCKDKTAAMNKMTSRPQTKENTKDENYQDNPKDIKVFDKQGWFIEHNEISRIANEKFKHHYREYAPIEWQLKNICELMNYLKDHEESSKAANKGQLLKEIFEDIKSDINFMLDKKQEYELEELSQDVKNTLENMQEITEDEIKDDTKRKQKLKQEDAEYKLEINKHRNATAKFQTKMKNQKLDNLTKENIAHINEEIEPINKIFKEHGVGEVSVGHLKPKEQIINKPMENNALAQTQEKLNHANELEDTNGKAPAPVAVVKQNGSKNLDNDISVVQAKNQNQINGDKNQTNKVEDGKNQQKENIGASHLKKEIVTTNKGKGRDNGLEQTQKKLDDIHNQENTSETSAAHDFVGNQNNLQNLKGGAKAGSQSKNGDVTKENVALLGNENAKKATAVINKPNSAQNDSFQTLSIQGQVQDVNNERNKLLQEQNKLLQEQNKKPRINQNVQKEEQVNNKQTMQNQNGINHKPFVLSGSALLIADILFFVFKSSLTPFPAVIGTGGLVLLFLVWLYKAFSSHPEQSLGNSVGPKTEDTEDVEQPLVKDNSTKTAEVNGSIPPQSSLTNDNKTK